MERRPGENQPLHVGITGASGLIGSLLVGTLGAQGHRVTRLVRRPAGRGELQWADRDRFHVEPGTVRDLDAIVHLAGESIGKRWTPARKRAIYRSRVEGTTVLARAMAGAISQGGPRILVSASAIGYYGDRGDEVLTESSPPGTGFLPDVVQGWEAATETAESAGVRVVRVRMGLPLSPDGGVLRRMLLPFRLGIGGRLGSGNQWMSWISPEDLVAVYGLALSNEEIRGVVNAVAPEPVRNAEFTRVLGRVLGRPVGLVVPAFALRFRFGEMADQAILASTRVRPEALLTRGYRFRYPDLEPALRHTLGG